GYRGPAASRDIWRFVWRLRGACRGGIHARAVSMRGGRMWAVESVHVVGVVSAVLGSCALDLLHPGWESRRSQGQKSADHGVAAVLRGQDKSPDADRPGRKRST